MPSNKVYIAFLLSFLDIESYPVRVTYLFIARCFFAVYDKSLTNLLLSEH